MLSASGKFFDQLAELMRTLLGKRLGFSLRFALFSLFFQALTDHLQRMLAMLRRNLARWLTIQVIADSRLFDGFQVA